MMSSGIPIDPNYVPREVLLSRITFPGQPEKKRPILVISKFSNRSFIPSSSTLVCLPITSNQNLDNYMIKINNKDLEENKFPKASQVIYNQIFTILKSDVVKRIGKVTPTFYDKVTNLIKLDILELC